MSPYTLGDGPQPGDDPQPFKTAITQTAAHVLGCLQSLHACADICAHVAYFGLGLNLELKPIEEHRISMRTILVRIADDAVSQALRNLVENSEFEYLEAIVNRSKHRSVIYTAYTFEHRSLADEQSWHGVVLWRFERLGKAYPVRRSEEFLTAELDRQRSALIVVSAALEEHLHAKWNEQKELHEARGERWPPTRKANDGENA
ncbi:hypothetical protein [Xanthomonas bonasiae]|uniref:hypothetical protein n=1 Tax=Xanthomonas bonasiae TaxID=2810351 RepID=UPI001CD8AB5B|nr:hypothetical protein [Xanthomonas surreyensis]